MSLIILFLVVFSSTLLSQDIVNDLGEGGKFLVKDHNGKILFKINEKKVVVKNNLVLDLEDTYEESLHLLVWDSQDKKLKRSNIPLSQLLTSQGSNISGGLWISSGTNGEISYVNGNVGIGTNNPLFNLHVGNESGTSPYAFVVRHTSEGGRVGIATNSLNAQLNIGGHGGLRFVTRGFISSPWPIRLNVGGSTNVDFIADNIRVNGFDAAATFNIRPTVPHRVPLVIQGQVGQSKPLTNWRDENGNTMVTVTADGKVGIGTTTPAEQLDVAGKVKATAFIGDGSQLTGISGGGGQLIIGVHKELQHHRD